MSIKTFTKSLLVLGLGAAPGGSVSAQATAIVAAKPPVSVAQPRVSQTAQTPARPAVARQVGSAAPGALPTAAPSTLWNFLGVPGGIRKMQGATRNRRGNTPGREPRPPLKAIADPANLQSGNPAIETAAKIKQQEDLKKQKIKALKYLATIGCGCYKGVKEALMDALDDCTEDVRVQAAESIGKAAENKCDSCSKTCCCDADMMQKLNDVATARDDNGCFVEPSAKVREAACEALMACRQRVRVYPAAAPAAPIRPYNEAQPDVPAPPGELQPDDMPLPPKQASNQPSDLLISEILGVPSANVGNEDRSGVAATAVSTRHALDRRQTFTGSSPASARGNAAPLYGTIVGIDPEKSTIDLEFAGARQPTVGSQFSIHHKYAFKTAYLGRVEVVYLADNGRVMARPVGHFDLAKAGKGDRASGRIVDEEQPGGERVTNVGLRTAVRKAPSCVTPSTPVEMPDAPQTPYAPEAPYVPDEPPAPAAEGDQAAGKRVRSFISSWFRPLGKQGDEVVATSAEQPLESPTALGSSWKSMLKPAIEPSASPALTPQTARLARPAKPRTSRGSENAAPGVVLLED